jgi:hypothetical protein
VCERGCIIISPNQYFCTILDSLPPSQLSSLPFAIWCIPCTMACDKPPMIKCENPGCDKEYFWSCSLNRQYPVSDLCRLDSSRHPPYDATLLPRDNVGVDDESLYVASEPSDEQASERSNSAPSPITAHSTAAPDGISDQLRESEIACRDGSGRKTTPRPTTRTTTTRTGTSSTR